MMSWPETLASARAAGMPEVQATVVPAADDMNGHTGPGRVGHTGPGRVGHTGPDQVGHTGSGERLHRR